MKPTFFFDTGVLLAAYETHDLARRASARAAIEQAMASGSFVTSSQVLHEFHKLATQGLLLSRAQSLSVLRHLKAHTVIAVDADRVLRAAQLQRARGLAAGDALVVQCALDAGCRILFTDALPAGLGFSAVGGNATLAIVNPLTAPPALHEPAAVYAVTCAMRPVRRSAPGAGSCAMARRPSTAPASAPGA